MAVFNVRAGTIGGKIIEKEFSAVSREDLLTILEKEGLAPISVKEKGVSIPLIKRGGRVKSNDLLVFNCGLSTLLKAGLPVVDSLVVLKDSSKNKRLASAIEDTVTEIRNGKTLSEAMRKNPSVFPELYSASVAAAERTGDLIPAIKGFIDFQKKMEAIRKKIVSATVYPAVLAITSTAVVIFLITYVVPSFAKIYLESGTELPLPTRIMMGITDIIGSNILIIAAVLASSVFTIRALYMKGYGKQRMDGFKLSLPAIGGIYRGYSAAKFSRTLGMVLKSGVPLIQGIEMSKGVLNNTILDAKLQRVIKKTQEGGSVSDAIRDEDFFPEITYRMFNVGEKSASLPVILDEIADFHEQEVSHGVSILTDLIEPALMVIIGFIIGAIVLLMYLPIFQLGSRV